MFNQGHFPINSTSVGQWDMLTTPTSYTLDDDLIKQLHTWLNKWVKLPMHNEPTWVKKAHGVPTLLARFDLNPGGFVIELEVRPQGVGSTQLFNPLFAERFAEVRANWPAFTSVQTEAHAEHGCDDHLWLERHALGDEPDEGLVLVRNMVDESVADHLVSRAIAPIATEGDKAYGLPMGWWQKVECSDDLPWSVAFVIKPLAGAKSHGVGVWVPSGSSSRPRGAYTRSKIMGLLDNAGEEMWLQPFHTPPRVWTDQGARYLMLRPFFGYDIPTGEWRYLGGSYLLGDTLRIHGTAATISGPLV